jgi:glycerol-3-phosphate dehydrogenase
MQGLKKNWDVVVVGGGITGAGILLESVRMGLEALLVEQRDFAWGTSSRSSKLVHGGLRYLKEGRIFLTREAVRERERLLQQAQGLVEPLAFLVPVYRDRGPGKWTLEAGLSLYDLIAKKRQHRFLETEEFVKLVPFIDQKELAGGFQFFDAQVDDARLVLRLLQEAQHRGGQALNYTSAAAIHRNDQGQVIGVTLKDTETHATKVVNTRLVINATGCWAEKIHPSPKPGLHLRPLRGSHLLFPKRVLPIGQAVSFMHPVDQRAVFVVPWEGAVIVGTTDLDHGNDIDREPVISEDEVNYLIKGVQTLFPSLSIDRKDCLSTIAGIRPVLSEGKLGPSEESREHAVWVDRGLVTVTGGKLTTFRRLAFDALKAARPFINPDRQPEPSESLFGEFSCPARPEGRMSEEGWQNLCGRYGHAALEIVRLSHPQDLEYISGTRTLWAELPYAARCEQVRHLSDLLLRRVRIGLLTAHGGRLHVKRIRKLLRPVLPWDHRRWKWEIRQYQSLWQESHGLPDDRKIQQKGILGIYDRIRRVLGRP